MVDMKILQSNFQGYTSKQTSVKNICEEKAPDVYCGNETSMKGNRKIEIDKYLCFTKNSTKHMHGIVTMVASYLRPNTVKVAEGREGDEYLVTRYDHIHPALNIINYYGEQEKGDEEKGKKEKIMESWRRLLEDIKEIENRKENMLLIGDMNRAVGAGEWGIEGNKPNISVGGSLIRDLLATSKYILLNSLPIAKGGPWTWVDRSNTSVKSCLDIGIISAGLLPFVTDFQVDKEQKFTPRRLRKTKKGIVSTYSDHFSLEVQLSGLPRATESNKSKEAGSSWNLKKEKGFENYKEETKKIAGRINYIIKDNSLDIEECMTKIDAENNKAKWAAFGKTRNTAGRTVTNTRRKCLKSKEIEAEHEQIVKERVEKDEEQLREQNRKIEDEVNEIKKASHGQLTRVFKMRNKITGGKKQGQEPSAIRDPEREELLVKSSSIKAATLKYCINNLKDNKLDEDAGKIFKLKENLHNLRMKEYTKEEFDIGSASG